jgi:hypothetical protein
MRRQLRDTLNRVLGSFDLELVRRGQGAFENYLPLRSTLAGAKAAGSKVGDFIDAIHNVPGATDQTLSEMAQLGVFNRTIDCVCELGPGSGRYLERTLQRCRPARYEVYETAKDWRDWLASTYPIIAHKADGVSFSRTPTASVDLMQAHKVLPGLPIFVACRYLTEMARVTRLNGMVVFDVLTEQCLGDELVSTWLSRHAWPQSMFPKEFVIAYLNRRGLAFVGSFVISMAPGITEYFVFSRAAVPGAIGKSAAQQPYARL